MDIGANRIFELLRERQAVQRDAERELLERWNGELIRFIDDNRKNDVARAMVLAEQLARENQVGVLKAEHLARLKELRREHADRESRLDAELLRNRAEALAQLTARQSEWNNSLALEQERTRSTSALADQLSAQMALLSHKYEEQYRGQINTLEADKQSYAQELDRAGTNQKRANNTMVALVIILAIAALAVGVIAGWAWGSAGSAGAADSAASASTGFAVIGAILTGLAV
jgi:hypothetical protein